MLSVAGEYLHEHNPQARLIMVGQELNDESYAICKADMLIKGQDVSKIKPGDTLANDGHAGEVFDYMLSNPPFGVEWKQSERAVRKEHEQQGYNGRFGPGLPRISDGSLLFMLHLVKKMRPIKDGGARFCIVQNGSPLFTGGAGSGESEIRRYLLENDLVEAIVALPTEMFYNTGIATYLWIVTNHKTPQRKGKLQLIDASGFFSKMRKSLGNKRRELSDVLLTKDSETADDIAKSAYVPQDMPGVVCGYHLSIARARGRVLGIFLKRAFDTHQVRAQAEVSSNGLTRVGLSQSAMDCLQIPVPPLAEQEAIAEFLDKETAKIDELIEEQRRLIELLKEKRQASISHAVTKGLDPSAPMKDSGVAWIGQFPQHCHLVQARRIVSRIEQGWSPQCDSEPAGDSDWGVLKAGCVNRGVYCDSENKALPPSEEPLSMYEVRVGDVLMSRASGSPELVGSTALVAETRSKLMISDKIFRIHLTGEAFNGYFVDLFNSAALRFQIEGAISGADGLANNLPQSALKSFLCPLPPLSEQKKIHSFLEETGMKTASLIISAEKSIFLLQERRSALISAAVTGQINVSLQAPKPVRSTWNSGFARQVIAAEALTRCNGPRMGRIKLQKLIHLCEYHAQLDEIRGDYSRKAAGPFDPQVMASIRKGLKQQQWFEEYKDGDRYAYRPLEKSGGHQQYLKHWEEKQAKIEEVLNLLGGARTRTCEIASTLYAAWNDLLIEGKSPTDAEIIHEASSAERWHASKEKIAADKWSAALAWMREKGLVPIGYGAHTKHKVNNAAEEIYEPA